MSYKDKHNLDNISKRECECPISFSLTNSGTYHLECGECLKIFESDEPTEITLEAFRSNINDCNIFICLELQNGKNLEFEIPKGDTFGSDGILTTTKQARKVTVECKSDSLEGGTCAGSWEIVVFLRGSETDRRCECPVETAGFASSDFVLKSGESRVIFQSDEPSEMSMNVDLFPNTEESLLTVIVELEKGTCLKFIIQAPTSGFSNDILFYSKNVLKITFECLSLTNCRGVWVNRLIKRGA